MHSAALRSAVQAESIEVGRRHVKAGRDSTVQYGTRQKRTVHYSTVRYSTVQYSTVQDSTGQDSTGQDTTV